MIDLTPEGRAADWNPRLEYQVETVGAGKR